jgi:hypothetical protein
VAGSEPDIDCIDDYDALVTGLGTTTTSGMAPALLSQSVLAPIIEDRGLPIALVLFGAGTLASPTTQRLDAERRDSVRRRWSEIRWWRPSGAEARDASDRPEATRVHPASKTTGWSTAVLDAASSSRTPPARTRPGWIASRRDDDSREDSA